MSETFTYKGRTVEIVKIKRPAFRGRPAQTFFGVKVNGELHHTMFSSPEYARLKIEYSIDDGNYRTPRHEN